jgi:multicomponent Na+:H+ antiporter subunit D
VAELLPGLSIALRADALSMIFAVAASFLWVVTVFYSAGYMRGLEEHAQTRFNACFALALFGAIGCAFADNLLHALSLLRDRQHLHLSAGGASSGRRGYEGGRKYLVYLTATAKGLVLPAMVLIYVLTGSLDFADNIRTGILPPDAHRGVVTASTPPASSALPRTGSCPCTTGCPAPWWRPRPVSALLHAVAVVKVGVFSTVRVMLHVFGVDLMDALNLGLPTAYFVSFTILAASVIALSKDNLKARLAYSTVSQLSYIILGVALLTPAGSTAAWCTSPTMPSPRSPSSSAPAPSTWPRIRRTSPKCTGWAGPCRSPSGRLARRAEHDRRPARGRVHPSGICWSAPPTRGRASWWWACWWPAPC